MSISRRICRTLAALAAFAVASSAAIGTAQTFTVTIPDRSPNLPVGAVRITLETNNDPTGATLNIGSGPVIPLAPGSQFAYDPASVMTIASVAAGNPAVITTPTAHGLTTLDFVMIAGTTTTPSINAPNQQVTVINATQFSIPVNVTSGQAGPGGNLTRSDVIRFRKLAGVNKLEILLTLRSNLVGTEFCVKKTPQATLPQNRNITLTLPAGVTVTGHRLTSYTALSTNECTCAVRRIQTTPVGFTTPPPGTALGRHALDVILVLDRSGSMDDPASGAPPNSDPKLALLKWAVGQFIDAWKLEASAVPEDRIAVVWFESGVQVGSNFVARSVPNGWDGIKTAVDMQTTAGATALGDGISRAIQMWKADQQNDAHIVLMTNGMQNRGNQIIPGNQTNEPTLAGIPDLACFDLDLAKYVVLHGQCVPVQSIGVGAPGSAQSNLLDKISLQTGGSSGVTVGDKIDLTFLTALVNVLKGNTWSTLGQFDETMASLATANPPRNVDIDGSVRQLIAVVAWRTRQARLDLAFRDPNGATVAAASRADNPFYTVQTINLPSSGPPGTWQVTVTRPPGGRVVVPYHVSFYAVEGRLEFKVRLVKALTRAGEPLAVEVEISQDKKPLTNLGNTVTARPFVPPTAVGDLLRKRKVPGSVLTTDPAGFTTDSAMAANAPYQRKLHHLIVNNGVLKELTPVEMKPGLTMRDDGNGPDARLSDGTYSASHANTNDPGPYQFEVSVDFSSTATGRIRRTEVVNTELIILPDPDSTNVTPGGNPQSTTRTLTIEPADRNGHYLGPGFAGLIKVTTSSGSVASIVDPDETGTYVVTLTGVMPNVDPTVTVVIDGVPLYDAPLSQISTPVRRVAVFAGLGLNVPSGAFDTLFDGGFSLQGGVEFMLTKSFSLEGVFGFDRFNGVIDDLNLTHLSARAKAYAPAANPRVAGFVGAGRYWFDPGDSYGGVSTGGVVEFRVAPSWSVEATYTFHNVYTTGGDTRFSAIHGGIRFRF